MRIESLSLRMRSLEEKEYIDYAIVDDYSLELAYIRIDPNRDFNLKRTSAKIKDFFKNVLDCDLTLQLNKDSNEYQIDDFPFEYRDINLKYLEAFENNDKKEMTKMKNEKLKEKKELKKEHEKVKELIKILEEDKKVKLLQYIMNNPKYLNKTFENSFNDFTLLRRAILKNRDNCINLLLSNFKESLNFSNEFENNNNYLFDIRRYGYKLQEETIAKLYEEIKPYHKIDKKNEDGYTIKKIMELLEEKKDIKNHPFKKILDPDYKLNDISPLFETTDLI